MQRAQGQRGEEGESRMNWLHIAALALAIVAAYTLAFLLIVWPFCRAASRADDVMHAEYLRRLAAEGADHAES